MTTIIKTEHLKFSYDKKQVLNDINLTVHSGEIIGLIGVNGAGKTTLLNILLGLLSGKGDVTVFDQKPGAAASKARLGSMLQGDMIIPGITVGDMLKLAAEEADHALDPDRLMADLNLTQLKTQRLGNLSGGQLRRLTFAIALIGQPDLLFLDEPAVGMDANARKAFWDKIEQLRQQGKTIVITSHYLEEIQQVADRLLILQNGRFIFDGSLQQLQKQHLGATITCETDLQPAIFNGLADVDHVHSNGDKLVIHSRNGDRTLRALVPMLDRLHQISLNRESLEDIFLQLTKQEAAS
ncbi:ABC transporter ATP-binding protein [Lacticaseibacillus chiayiensis]|uniref:ABC transporter ATP-binding protein n=1 Tax=Lacticaseibacillus chiayiensis TaxID=2100821 RepID=UPI001010F3D9|nr:ABC transporter ATP-binding protein [Lacticaseibacillus chiayiensis]RXT58363.1 multidrug ABC transporter ATP-binding protein [Lacticaseibacillus chiayiensis]